MTEPPKPKSKKGFASMSPDRLREVSSRGGSNRAPEDRPFAKDPKLASYAGWRGGSRKKKVEGNEP